MDGEEGRKGEGEGYGNVGWGCSEGKGLGLHAPMEILLSPHLASLAPPPAAPHTWGEAGHSWRVRCVGSNLSAP